MEFINKAEKLVGEVTTVCGQLAVRRGGVAGKLEAAKNALMEALEEAHYIGDSTAELRRCVRKVVSTGMSNGIIFFI